jgi:hypothetical protein
MDNWRLRFPDTAEVVFAPTRAFSFEKLLRSLLCQADSERADEPDSGTTPSVLVVNTVPRSILLFHNFAGSE